MRARNSYDIGSAWHIQEAKHAGDVAVAAARKKIVPQLPPPVFFNNPKCLGREQGEADIHGKDLYRVASARLQGNVIVTTEPFRDFATADRDHDSTLHVNYGGIGARGTDPR